MTEAELVNFTIYGVLPAADRELLEANPLSVGSQAFNEVNAAINANPLIVGTSAWHEVNAAVLAIISARHSPLISITLPRRIKQALAKLHLRHSNIAEATPKCRPSSYQSAGPQFCRTHPQAANAPPQGGPNRSRLIGHHQPFLGATAAPM